MIHAFFMASSVRGLRRWLAAGAGFCLASTSAFAQNWQQVRLPGPWGQIIWQSIASSADCSTLVVLNGDGNGIAISTNFGANWTSNAPLGVNSWIAAACSADGSKIFLTSYGDPQPGPIAVSTNAGVTWTASGAPMEPWSVTAGPIACSANGNIVMAASGYGPVSEFAPAGIYVSTNTGNNWVQTPAPTQYWSGVACSSDGAKMVAVSASADVSGQQMAGAIFTSTNSGATWTQTSAPTNNWTSVASSADGSTLVAAYGGAPAQHPGPGGIFISTNAGASWTQSGAPSANWLQVVSSADGATLAALTAEFISTGGPPFALSTNSGLAWITPEPNGDPPIAMAISADGSTLAATSDDPLFLDLLELSPPSFVTVELSPQPSNAVTLEWNVLIGQTYKVQYSTDLSQTNWTDLKTGLISTNGVLSAVDSWGTNTSRFYRAVLVR